MISSIMIFPILFDAAFVVRQNTFKKQKSWNFTFFLPRRNFQCIAKKAIQHRSVTIMASYEFTWDSFIGNHSISENNLMLLSLDTRRTVCFHRSGSYEILFTIQTLCWKNDWTNVKIIFTYTGYIQLQFYYKKLDGVTKANEHWI